MGEPSARRIVRVTNPRGLHLRMAAEISKAARRFDARVHLIKENHRVDVGEVIEILALCACPNEKLTIEASGVEAEAVLDELVAMFASNSRETETETPQQ